MNKKLITFGIFTLFLLVLSPFVSAYPTDVCWYLNRTGTPGWTCVTNMTQTTYINTTNNITTINNITNNITTTNNITINITNNFTTVNNITNNITVYNGSTTINNITNNITTTNNITSGLAGVNFYEDGSTITLDANYTNGTNVQFTVSDSTGSNNYLTNVVITNYSLNQTITYSRNGLSDITVSWLYEGLIGFFNQYFNYTNVLNGIMINITANNNSAFSYLNTLGANNTNIMSSNVTTNARIDNVNGTSRANNITLTGLINGNNATFTTFVSAVASNMTATNSQNVTTNARIDNVNASVNANNLTVFSYFNAIISNLSSINNSIPRNLTLSVTGTNVTIGIPSGTNYYNISFTDQTGSGSTAIKNATFVVVGSNTTLFMGLTDGSQYNTSFTDQSSAGGTSVKNITVVQPTVALNGINVDNVTLFIGLTDGTQSNQSILLHVPKTPWDEADTNGGYFRENDFDNPSGYGTIWGAVAINVGTLATVNGTGDGSGNGGLSNDPGIVSITTNATSMGGYAYNTSSIQYQLKEGWGSLTCFRAFARQGEIASVAQTSNWSTGRFGFMDTFTNINVVDGVFINYSWTNATSAILNGVVRNNSVANYTTTNVRISNGSVYCGMVYMDNTTARFSLYQNGTPGLGVSVWNDSISMYPWNLGRNTGAGMVWFATSNSTGAYVFAEGRYTNIFMNKTLYR